MHAAAQRASCFYFLAAGEPERLRERERERRGDRLRERLRESRRERERERERRLPGEGERRDELPPPAPIPTPYADGTALTAAGTVELPPDGGGAGPPRSMALS